MPDHSAPNARRPRTLGALIALSVVLAACGASTQTSEPPASQAAASQPAASQPASAAASQATGGTTVTLRGLAFSVSEITVPVGKLTFMNEDAVVHVLAEGENGKEVESPRVQKVSINGGTQGDLVFTVAGDYHITCTVHPTMNMEVKVE
jgi:plastocyanin